MICKEDAGRMNKIKTEAINSRQLLKKTENLISTQSDILSGELERIHHVIEKDKFTDSGIQLGLSRLQHHIQYLKKSSLQLNAGLSATNFSSEIDFLPAEPETNSEGETEGAEAGIMTEGNN